MESLLPVINKLQDVMVSVGLGAPGSIGLDLPQIVVVGSQSVGKSSVLESLVQRDFLPRGAGVVTRRPLILQLRNIQSTGQEGTSKPPEGGTDECTASKERRPSSLSSDDGRVDVDFTSDDYTSVHSPGSSKPGLEEWGTFLHRPGVIFEKFEDIRKEIEQETERLVGRTKKISPEPILLKIYSRRVVDLTLVDLPGITKVPVGDQPSDIEQQIRRMIMSFISKPNSIILAVSAANTDLANSDALQMAREVDPGGRRTIGVITKCDLMDAETDALDMLLGRIYPLQRGYVGVVCRSQKNINSNVDISSAIKEEERFFACHPAYRSITHRCGTRFLGVLLNQILMLHIQQSLPELKRQIQTLTQQYEAELATYGDSLIEAHGNQGALLLHCFSKFSRNFQDSIDGRLCAISPSSQLTGGARINYIFHDWFGKALSQFNPLNGLSDIEIRTAIRNATGPKASLFVPEGAFEILVRKQIAKLEQPALQCVEQVYEELQRIVEKCDLAEAHRFRFLRERIVDVVKMVLKKCLGPTNQMISNLIQMELAYLNTNHPDFLGGNAAMCSRAGAAFLLGYTQPTTSTGAAANGQLASHVASHRTGSLPFTSTLGDNGTAVGYCPQEGSAGTRPANAASVSQTPHRSYEYMPTTRRETCPLPQAATGSADGALPAQAQPQGLSMNANGCVPASNVAASPTQYSVGGLLSFFRGHRGGPGQCNPNQQPIACNPAHSINGGTSPRLSNAAAGPLLPHTQGSSYYPDTSKDAHHPIASVLPSPMSALSSQPQINPMHYVLPHPGNYGGGTGPSAPSGAPVGYYSTTTSGGIRLAQVPAVVTPSQVPSEREKTEIELIKLLIASYFNIVRKNVADYIPKATMSFMVNTAKDVIQRELVSQLYKPGKLPRHQKYGCMQWQNYSKAPHFCDLAELFGELLYEGDDIAQARERCKNSLQTLRTALEILHQILGTDWEE